MASPLPPDAAARTILRHPPRPKGLAFILSIITLIMYCGFVLLVGYEKAFLASTIIPGLSWGILLGASVIITSWVLTYIYVVASNRPSSVH